jgi:NIMA (never in mitosis gene a)-related kinase 2
MSLQDRIIDRENTTIFIIMEYCENGDLASVIRKYKRSGKKMDESKVWSIFFQLVCALHECHCRKDKILHRDIKPANVFIDRHHNFKLGDFGLARVLGAEHQFAQTNVGTPYYMSPEQVNEVPYNEKCDIWSLGCLIYELAALAPPFEANNQLALAVKIKAGRVARLPEPFSDELSAVVRSMLQVDTARRPSVQDLLRLPRLQEEAEMVVRSATAVPPVYLDRYFAAQMKRLACREEELNARAVELTAWEKDLSRDRPATAGGGSGGGCGGGAAAAEAAERREAEALRRERAASEGLQAVEEREKVRVGRICLL